MTKDQVKKILDRVLSWPPEGQADVAHIVELMEEQDKSDLRLNDEHVAEVKQRLADPNPKFLSLNEVREMPPVPPSRAPTSRISERQRKGR